MTRTGTPGESTASGGLHVECDGNGEHDAEDRDLERDLLREDDFEREDEHVDRIEVEVEEREAREPAVVPAPELSAGPGLLQALHDPRVGDHVAAGDLRFGERDSRIEQGRVDPEQERQQTDIDEQGRRLLHESRAAYQKSDS